MIVAEVTSNPRWLSDPACLAIDVSTSEGKSAGLHKNGVISCLHLVTMSADRLGPPIGSLPPAQLRQLDGCVKVALELP